MAGFQRVVCTLLDAGAPVDSSDIFEKRPLETAASKGHLEVGRILLDHGAKPLGSMHSMEFNSFYDPESYLTAVQLSLYSGYRCRDPNPREHRWPIIIAARGGNIQALQALLALGYNFDFLERKTSALIQAATKGHARAAEFLLIHGASANLASKEISPLIAAVVHGHSVIVNLLLAAGANPDIQIEPRLPGQQTSRSVFEVFAKAEPDTTVDCFGKPPIVLALEAKQARIVQLLLEAGAIVTDDALWATTPDIGAEAFVALLYRTLNDRHIDDLSELFSRAAQAGTITSALHVLLEYKGYVNKRDKCDRSLLSYAAEGGNFQTVKTLLKAGAFLYQDIDFNPLILSCSRGNHEVVELLLDFKADIEQEDNCGRRPLSYAAEKGRVKVVQSLLDRGADINAVDTQLRSALSWTASSSGGDIRVIDALVMAGANVNHVDGKLYTPLLHSLEDIDTVKALLQLGADVEHRDQTGRTALLIATQLQLNEVVRVLLEAGADVDQAASSGRTPISYAAEREATGIARMLVEADCDVYIKDKDGRAPRDYLRQACGTEWLAWLDVTAAKATKKARRAKRVEADREARRAKTATTEGEDTLLPPS
ncbi:ankyrin repeat-containing domain protein [Aspergillus californicus]